MAQLDTDPNLTRYQRLSLAVEGKRRVLAGEAEARELVERLRGARRRKDWRYAEELLDQAVGLAVYMQTAATLIATAQARPRWFWSGLTGAVGLVVGTALGWWLKGQAP